MFLKKLEKVNSKLRAICEKHDGLEKEMQETEFGNKENAGEWFETMTHTEGKLKESLGYLESQMSSMRKELTQLIQLNSVINV